MAMRGTRRSIVIVALVLMGGSVVVLLRPRAPSVVTVGDSVLAIPEETRERRWLDGQPLAVGVTQPRAVAVVVDNAPEARPLSGIADAPLVFEVPVEGGRTRLLAVFPEDAELTEVGPVRSARPAFVGLAEVLRASLVHVGGSPAALDLLRTLAHVDQYYDPPFWRSRQRFAPFNVYTSIPELLDHLAPQDRQPVDAEGCADPASLWSFDDTVPEERADGDAVRVAFGDGAPFVVQWTYDPAQGAYVRSQAGQPHVDATGSVVTAANVLLLEIDTRALDRVGRLEVTPLDPEFLPGRAEERAQRRRATLYRDGRRVEGKWAWSTCDGGRFSLTTAAEGLGLIPMALRPGPTWVLFVDEL